MSSSLNKVMLIGHLGADPDIRDLPSGTRVANLRIATNERWKDREGQYQEKTEWHSVVVYSPPLVELIARSCKKGHRIYIEGKLETRKWQDKDNKERYSTEIVLRGFGGEIRLLEKRETNANDTRTDPRLKRPQEYRDNTRNRPYDDEIPF